VSLGFLHWLRRVLCWLFGCNEAVRLNLRIDGIPYQFFKRHIYAELNAGRPRPTKSIEGAMAKIGESFTARIAPTNVAGAPAPVFSVEWFEDGDAFNVSPSPDGLSAVFTAVAASVGNVANVRATTKGGATLSASVALPDVEAPPVDEEAVALNLTLA
jgi:hypothetical protein